MSEVRPALWRSGWIWLPLTAVAILADQLTKEMVVDRFALHDSITVLPVLDIMRAHNTGAAFRSWQAPVVGSAGSSHCSQRGEHRHLYWLRSLTAGAELPSLGLPRDEVRLQPDRPRAARPVVDFSLCTGTTPVPAFNVADSWHQHWRCCCFSTCCSSGGAAVYGEG